MFMNRCDYLDPALAWTGVKNSGRGVSLSKFGTSTDLFSSLRVYVCVDARTSNRIRPVDESEVGPYES